MPRNFSILHFRIKEGITKAHFLKVHKILNRNFICKQRGYLCQRLYIDEGIWRGETDKWQDFVEWESKDQMINIFKEVYGDEAVIEFLSLVEPLAPGEMVSLKPDLVKQY